MRIIKSPITNSEKIKKIQDLDIKKIQIEYLKRFDVNTHLFFQNVDFLSLYECLETGYQFYYPFVSGDGNFYKQLSQFEWYYMPFKWEHRKSFEILKSNDNVLEIGCGKGGFLEYIKEKNNTINTTGLELNLDAQKKAHEKGLNVLSESLEQHSVKFTSHYDIVCSFQVLEHIAEVKPFISQQIDCLKSGGKLIIGVPNNDGFAKYDFENDILNMPPHHMGLWDSKSIRKLSSYFPINFIALYKEPLQSYHVNWFLSILDKRIRNKSKIVFGLYRISGLKKLTNIIVSKFPDLISGHTLISVFEKK